MNAKQQQRHDTRVRIFTRRGWSQAKASDWATRLAARDEQRDDRRLCIECAGLMRNGACIPAQRGNVPGACKATEGRHVFTPVLDILQRCEAFSWQTQ